MIIAKNGFSISVREKGKHENLISSSIYNVHNFFNRIRQAHEPSHQISSNIQDEELLLWFTRVYLRIHRASFSTSYNRFGHKAALK